jgi:hypothetical protein
LISGVITGVTAGAIGFIGAELIPDDAAGLRFAALFFAGFFLAALRAGFFFAAFFEDFFFEDFFFAAFFFATRFLEDFLDFLDDFFFAVFLAGFFFAAFFFAAMVKLLSSWTECLRAVRRCRLFLAPSVRDSHERDW